MSRSTRVRKLPSAAVVDESQEGSAKRIEVRGGWRVGVGRSLGGGVLFFGAEPLLLCVACTTLASSRSSAATEKKRLRQVGRRIGLQDCVVDVPGILMPGIEDDFLVGVVRMDGGNDSCRPGHNRESD